MCGLPLDLGGNFLKKGAREHVERRNAPYLLLNFCRHNGIAGILGPIRGYVWVSLRVIFGVC